MASEYQRVEELFDRVLDFNPTERAAYLAGACGNDIALRRRVEDLLLAHEAKSGFLSPGTVSPRAQSDSASLDPPTISFEHTCKETVGAMVGRYKLLEKIGEGGFGIVWAAEQREPVKRRVALKIIKLGMDTQQVVARFEAERQALALMDHPGIAKVLDAGSTDAGRPFFVMELVRGIPLTDYCTQEKASTRTRLELFIKVCQAIQHAHQKGLIHRDIKPSNVLVTMHDGVPVPKVIDFGIAKATQQELTEKTIYTQYSQFIGTPAYMSPEQAEMSGLDIDTRSDIYSLGVLLYELLTGAPPFDSKELLQSGLDEMRRILRERDPERPSSKLSRTLSADANVDPQLPSRLPSTIDSDLDWIAMRCLEKDRSRRYESATGLALDVGRYLCHEPVVARPPSTTYRMKKAWQRNKVVYSAASVVAVSLLVTVVVSCWMAVVAWRAKDEAVLARNEANLEAKAASDASDEANEERIRAEASELQSHRTLYATEMMLAQRAVESNNLGLARHFLSNYGPRENGPDFRGFEWRYLWKQARGDEAFVVGHNQYNVMGLALSSDGRYLVSGSGLGGGDVRLWDLHKRRQVATPVEEGARGNVAFASDGRTIAFGLRSKEVVVWDVIDREEVCRIPGTLWAREGELLFFEGGSKLLVASSMDGITTWNLRADPPSPINHFEQGQSVVSVVQQPGKPTSFVAIVIPNHDEGLVRTLIAYDLETGNRRELASSHVEYFDAAFSSDGSMVALAASPHIDIYDMAEGKIIKTLRGHDGLVSALAFSPDGLFLASGSRDHTIRLWDARTWKQAAELRGHLNEISSLAFSSTSGLLYSGGKDAAIRAWSCRATLSAQATPHTPSRAFCSRDGSSYVTIDRTSRKATIWEMRSHSIAKEIQLPPPRDESFFMNPPSAVDSGGKRLATALDDRNIVIHDRELNRQEIVTLPGELTLDSLEYAPSGDLFVLYDSGQVDKISTSSHSILTVLESSLADAASLSFSDDGSRLAVGDHLGNALIWSLQENRVEMQWKPHFEWVTRVVFFPDGRTFATCSTDATLRIWDLRTQTELARLNSARNAYWCMAMSADGSRLAAGTDSGEIKFFDVSTRLEVASFQTEEAPQNVHHIGMLDENTIVYGQGGGGPRTLRAPSWREIEAIEQD